MRTEILLTSGLTAIFYIVMLIFVVFSVSLAYHWFTFGSSKKISMLSLCVYLVGSAPLFLLMSLSLTLL